MHERHGPLVSCETLWEHLEEDWVVFDCRHDLQMPATGPLLYQEGHIPGAFHAHVDDDLSGDPGDGSGGRHPLPDPDAFCEFLSEHGVGPDTQVVAYDDMGGAWAGRLWWLLRHYGHEAVAVLDGGIKKWQDEGLPLRKGDEEPRAAARFEGKPGAMPTIDADAVAAAIKNGGLRLVDVRVPERYRGEMEPVDPVAGHIPTAINVPFSGNLSQDGLWLSPDELRARYEALVDGRDAKAVACYCGSGVTAAHGVLAMEVADLGTPSLYPGSWSEWCQPGAKRPVAKG